MQDPVNSTNYAAHAPCFLAPSPTCEDFISNKHVLVEMKLIFSSPYLVKM